MKKRITALILSFLLVFTMIPANAYSTEFSDMPDDWSTAALENAANNGLLSGYNGSLKPNSNLTRAEMAAVVNRAFGAFQTASLDSYTDVPNDSWFYDEMAKAVAMQTFTGNGDRLNPNSNITREEAFVVLFRAFNLSGGENNVLERFPDGNLVSDWAVEGISSLINAGYISGSGDRLNPKGYITRAEFAQVMDNLIKNYIKLPGTYTDDFNGNVMINAAGVTLKNLTVNGDLIIGDGVGDGEVILEDVTVTGRVLIRGGGENSIKMTENSNIDNIIDIRKNLQIADETGEKESDNKSDAIKSYGNEFEIGTYEEFETGIEFNDVKLSGEIGDGALILKKQNGEYPSHGEYISQIIDVPNFEYMVVSWNSDAPEGTYVEIQARVLVNHFDEDSQKVQTWTDWLSWGEWGPFIERCSYSTEDELAEISVDELMIKGSNGETGEKVQLKAILYSEDPSVTPTVRYLHGTLKNTLPDQYIEKKFGDNEDVSDLNKVVPTPRISQMQRDPIIASSICSPTSLTMMLNRMGEDLIPEEVAQNNYDFNYGFGNWAITMASAGSYGYKAYVDYTTVEGLKREIAKGYPVGVSVKYTNDPKNQDYPYIEGAPGTTGGHLFVVTGFESKNGVEYVIVNDPYAPENGTVERHYKLEQFKEAWSNRTAYIVHDKEKNAGFGHTKRVEAELRETETPGEYEVYYGTTNIDVANFGGNIIYTVDNGKTFSYFAEDEEGKNSLTFEPDVINNPDLTVYIVTDTGYVYVATAEASDR